MDYLARKWVPETLSEFSQRRYHAYPHANGFSDNGTALVFGQIEADHVSLWKISLARQPEQLLGRFRAEFDTNATMPKPLWFDIAEATNVLVVVAENAIWLIDLNRFEKPNVLYRPTDGDKLYEIPSIAADGRHVLANVRRHDGTYFGLRIDVSTGEGVVLFAHDWWANHIHYSPHDSRWVSYCHEGNALEIRDRMWAWHSAHAPSGHAIMDQHWDDDAGRLSVGHERACFHAASAVAIAYGASLGGPRGLYETPLDARTPARLVSRGDRDWHCNVTRDGRWAVIDTTGPHDQPGKGWENAGQVSDIILVKMQTGERQVIARSHQVVHPWHPHPAFSPDGNLIIFNEGKGSSDAYEGRVLLLRPEV